MLTRRQFTLRAASALLHPCVPPFGLAQDHPAPPSARPNVAALDHDRILAEAAEVLNRAVTPVDGIASDAFLRFTLDLPTLAAAQSVAPDPRYAARAAKLISTAVPGLPTALQRPADVADLVLLAECMVAAPVVGFNQVWEQEISDSLKSFARALLANLTDSRTGGLARDSKDHVASAHLLLTTALATLLGEDAVLTEARTRINRRIPRDQINSAGLFLHELTSSNPFRNSLFNLDMLAGSAVLLATPFDSPESSPWLHELPDGPGLRAAVSAHARYIATPSTWPYPADDTLFHKLPGRRPALLFAARAYSSPEYMEIWRDLTPKDATQPARPAEPELLRAFPIRQPVLWTNRSRKIL